MALATPVAAYVAGQAILVTACIYFISYRNQTLTSQICVDLVCLAIATWIIIIGFRYFDGVFQLAPTPQAGGGCIDAEIPNGVRPPGGVFAEILPLVSKDPNLLTPLECRRIVSYLIANPWERINDPVLGQYFAYCQYRLKHYLYPTQMQLQPPLKNGSKKVVFTDFIEAIDSTGNVKIEPMRD